MICNTFSAVAGSKAAVCSSSRRILGGTIVAISSVSACLCPPDKSPTGCVILSSRPIPSLDSCSWNFFLSFLVIWESQPPEPAASARFSSMVMPGALPLMGSWYSRPIIRALTCCGTKVISLPSNSILPPSVRKSPQIALNSVDFPAPLEPMIVAKSPGFKWSVSPVIACFSLAVPGLKVLEIFDIFNILSFLLSPIQEPPLNHRPLLL